MQVQLRRESDWMARQPKARSTKSQARIDAFHELKAKAQSGPRRDFAVDFGDVQMARQGNKVLVMKVCTVEAFLLCTVGPVNI
jgi:ABC transport system ATP-binding/permease protein